MLREDSLQEQIHDLKQGKACLESCLRKARGFLRSEEARSALDEYQEVLWRIAMKENQKTKENFSIEMGRRVKHENSEGSHLEEGTALRTMEEMEKLKNRRNVIEEKLTKLLNEESLSGDKVRGQEFIINKLKTENNYLKEELDSLKVLAKNDAMRTRFVHASNPAEKSKDRFPMYCFLFN